MPEQDVPALSRSLHETRTWLNDIADEMGFPDRQMAYHALRGVLFALRDLLVVEEALDLAAQLPALVRGIYFEGYKATGKPLTYRDRDEFLERVARELQPAGGANPDTATRAVFAVLNRHVSPGEVEEVRQMLPKAIRQLWPAPEEQPSAR